MSVVSVSRNWLITGFCVFTLGGCGGGGGGSSSQSDLPTTLQSLQAQGKLPSLDTNSSVSGIDANSNGVRDDLEAIIAAQGDSAAQKASEFQLAKALQVALLVDSANASATALAASGLNLAIACIWSNYSSDLASDKVKRLEQLTVNTMQRLTAYEGFNHAMDGTVMVEPKGVVCE
jgi:hypothetical protein